MEYVCYIWLFGWWEWDIRNYLNNFKILKTNAYCYEIFIYWNLCFQTHCPNLDNFYISLSLLEISEDFKSSTSPFSLTNLSFQNFNLSLILVVSFSSHPTVAHLSHAEKSNYTTKLTWELCSQMRAIHDPA